MRRTHVCTLLQKGMEATDVATDVLIALGAAPDKPTFVGTDNLANALVGSTWGSATRSRHFLRRYYLCVQRIKAGRAVIGHVPDTENPADFMTKWAVQLHPTGANCGVHRSVWAVGMLQATAGQREPSPGQRCGRLGPSSEGAAHRHKSLP